MTTTTTKPDDAIVRALLGDTDLPERAAAMTAEIERLADETRDVRVRAHAVLEECYTFESMVTDKLESIIDPDAATITPKVDLREGFINLMAALTHSDALHLALYGLGEQFQFAAGDGPFTEDGRGAEVEQEVAAQ